MAFNIHAVDKKAQKSGVWTAFEGSEFLIASTSSSAYQKRVAVLRKPLAKQIDKGTVDPDDLINMLCTALSEHILLDWKGVEGDKNVEIDYTQYRGLEAMKDNDDFREFVSDFGSTQANYEQEFKDEVVKK